jgi:Ran GTPase-activating protein (RanGAP) involved in mRNA processing and transport
MLSKTSSLDTLDLSHCGCIADNMVPVFTALCGEAPTLRKLVMRGNRVGNEGASRLAEVLRVNTQLRVLDIGDNGITAQGAEELALAARSNKALSELAMEHNDIGEIGLRALEAARSDTLALFL